MTWTKDVKSAGSIRIEIIGKWINWRLIVLVGNEMLIAGRWL